MPRKYTNLILECTVEELSECQKKYARDASEAYYAAIRKANDLVASLGLDDWTTVDEAPKQAVPAPPTPPPPPPPPSPPVETIDDDDDYVAPSSPVTVPVLTLAPLPRAERPLIDDAMFGGTNLTSEIPPPQRIPLRTIPVSPAPASTPMVSIVSLISLSDQPRPVTGVAASSGLSVTAVSASMSAPLMTTPAVSAPVTTPATSAAASSTPEVIALPVDVPPVTAKTTTTTAAGSGGRSAAAGRTTAAATTAGRTPTATTAGATATCRTTVTSARRPPPTSSTGGHQPEELQARSHPALHVAIRTPHALTATSKAQYSSRRSMLDQRVKKVLLHTPSQFTEWLIQTRLVRASQLCPAHPVTWSGQPRQLRLGMFTDSDKLAHSGGYVWVKTCCRPKFLSVYHGSLFDSAKLADPNTSAVSILKLIYHWSCQTPLNNVTHWLKLRPSVVDEVFGLLRAVCMLKVEEQAPKLGSVGGRVQVGLVSLGTAGIDGHNKNVKVEVLGVKDEVSGEIRLVGFEPRIKNRIRAVVGAVQEWVTSDCSLLLDHSISPLPFRPHFRRVENAPSATKDTPGNIMHYLRRSMPRMFQTCLVYLKPPTICQFIAEITWREKFGREPNATFSNMISHLGAVTQQNQGSLIDMLNKVLQSPSMDLKRKPRKQTLSTRPDCEPQFSTPGDSAQPKRGPPAPPSKKAPSKSDKPSKKQSPKSSQPPAKKQKLAQDAAKRGSGAEVVEGWSADRDLIDADKNDDTGSEASTVPSVDRGGSEPPKSGKRGGKKQRARGKGSGARQQPAADRQLPSFFKLGDLKSVKMPDLTDMRCWECKLPLTHPRHLTGVYACRRCRYTTCCEKIYPVHRRVFHSPGVLPVFSTGAPILLEKTLYCSCGYGTNSGNRLALHMSRCECRTAKPIVRSAAVKTETEEEVTVSETSLEPAPEAAAEGVRVKQDDTFVEGKPGDAASGTPEGIAEQDIVKHDDSLDLETNGDAPSEVRMGEEDGAVSAPSEVAEARQDDVEKMEVAGS